MIKIIVFILFTSLAVIFGPKFADSQGFVHIAFSDYIIELSVTTALIIYFGSLVLIYTLIYIFSKCVRLPVRTISLFRRNRTIKKLNLQDQAVVDFFQGQYEKSLSTLKSMSPVVKMNERSLIIAAQSAFAIGLYDYTRQALEELQKRGGAAEVASNVIRAKLNYNLGNIKVALEYLDKTKVQIQNKYIYELYLRCYSTAGRLHDIVVISKELLKYKVLTEEQYHEYYISYLEQALKNATTLDDMKELYKNISKADRKNSKIMGAFIFKLIKLGDVNKARELSLSLLKNEHDPNFLESISLWDIAIPDVLVSLKKYASANVITTQVNLPLLKAMANLEFRSGLLQDALEDYRLALSIEPSLETYLKIGTILTNMQKYSEATEFYMKADAIMSENTVLALTK